VDIQMTTAQVQPPIPPIGFWRAQSPIFLVAMGHGTLHWVTSILFILLPYIQNDLDLTYTEAGSLITIFHICATLANIPSGPMADIIGKRVLIMAGSLALCGAALVATGYANGYFMVAALIGMIGATSMSWHPPAMSYLSIRYPERRGFAVSIHGLGSSIMQAAGPAVAGAMMSTSTTIPFLALAMNWRDTAIINGAFPFCIGIIMFMLLKRTRRSVEGGDTSAKLRDYASGFKGILKNRAVITLCAVSGFRKLTQAGIFVFLPLYLYNVLKLDALMIGATLMSLQDRLCRHVGNDNHCHGPTLYRQHDNIYCWDLILRLFALRRSPGITKLDHGYVRTAHAWLRHEPHVRCRIIVFDNHPLSRRHHCRSVRP
jgi:MFS family permease